MGDRHVISDVNKQILYIDANNLYGWAMSQYLPTGNFEKLLFPDNYSQEQVVNDLLQIPNDNEYGFFIEYDIEYPVEIKEKTKNFPFLPLSNKFTLYMNSVNQPNYKPTSKLMCDVTNKNQIIDTIKDVQVLHQHGYEKNKNSHHLPFQAKGMISKIH